MQPDDIFLVSDIPLTVCSKLCNHTCLLCSYCAVQGTYFTRQLEEIPQSLPTVSFKSLLSVDRAKGAGIREAVNSSTSKNLQCRVRY